MSVYRGIRIRVRRANDNAILYDSQGPAANVSEVLIDVTPIAGNVQYVIEAMSVSGDPQSTISAVPVCQRQAIVALALHK